MRAADAAVADWPWPARAAGLCALRPGRRSPPGPCRLPPIKRPPLSLKGQALALLARREHSRAELRQKLLAHAGKQAKAAAASAAAAAQAAQNGAQRRLRDRLPAPRRARCGGRRVVGARGQPPGRPARAGGPRPGGRGRARLAGVAEVPQRPALCRSPCGQPEPAATARPASARSSRRLAEAPQPRRGLEPRRAHGSGAGGAGVPWRAVGRVGRVAGPGRHPVASAGGFSHRSSAQGAGPAAPRTSGHQLPRPLLDAHHHLAALVHAVVIRGAHVVHGLGGHEVLRRLPARRAAPARNSGVPGWAFFRLAVAACWASAAARPTRVPAKSEREPAPYFRFEAAARSPGPGFLVAVARRAAARPPATGATVM